MKCPKCGQEQEAAETCIGCGIVFAKYFEIQRRKTEGQKHSDHPEPSSADPRKSPDKENEILSEGNTADFGPLYALRRCWYLPWNPVSTTAMAALSVGFAVMLYLLSTKSLMGDDSVILNLVHGVNLVFHEAGHMIFAIFGNNTLTIFGGSLNQVLIPLIVAGSFWFKRDAAGFAFGLFWCFESLLDVAVYMADARALQLPLLGDLGEDAHDWRNLFFRFGLIDQDTAIAAKTRFVGWCGILATWVWFTWRWWRSKRILEKEV